MPPRVSLVRAVKGRSKQQQKRRGSKRNAAVSAGGNVTNTVINTVRSLFPVTTTRTLCYHQTVNMIPITGAVLTYVFSTNGLFNPNITGADHQPAGFDQIMLFYEHYYVRKAHIKVTCRNASGTTWPTIILHTNASPTGITNANQIQEDGSSVRVRLGNSALDSGMQSMSMTCDVAKFGGAKFLADTTAYQGSIAANPVEQSYFHITGVDGETSTTFSVYLDILITYTATFIEPRDVSPSLVAQMNALIVSSLKPSEEKEFQVVTAPCCGKHK